MKVDRWRTLVNSWVLSHSLTCTSWHSVWIWCVVQSAANVELVEVVSRDQHVSLLLWDERRHSELTEADWVHNEEDQWTPHYNSLTERTQNRRQASCVHFQINNGVYFVSASIHRSTLKWHTVDIHLFKRVIHGFLQSHTTLFDDIETFYFGLNCMRLGYGRHGNAVRSWCRFVFHRTR